MLTQNCTYTLLFGTEPWKKVFCGLAAMVNNGRHVVENGTFSNYLVTCLGIICHFESLWSGRFRRLISHLEFWNVLKKLCTIEHLRLPIFVTLYWWVISFLVCGTSYMSMITTAGLKESGTRWDLASWWIMS